MSPNLSLSRVARRPGCLPRQVPKLAAGEFLSGRHLSDCDPRWPLSEVEQLDAESIGLASVESDAAWSYPQGFTPRSRAMLTRDVTRTGQPLLITAETLATFLARVVRDVGRDHQAGRIRRSVALGGRTYWRPKVIRRWVRAGCPTRVE
jgi:hypothetical protein